MQSKLKKMELTKQKHGGKREGSGRKPNQVKKVQITFQVLPQYKEIVKETFKQILINFEKNLTDETN